MTRTVWQVASGPEDRPYAEVLVAHGVALIGPGALGPWSSEAGDERFDGSFARRFAAEPDRGPDFLRLANALSALYPKGAEEKRLLDAMLPAVPR